MENSARKVIVDKCEYLSRTPSDINEHLLTIREYASECNVIVEMGVRWVVSSWAFLAGFPKKMTSIDIVHPDKYGPQFSELVSLARDAGVEFNFILGDTLKLQIHDCDLLFIDTLHTYNQLINELQIHSPKVKKYIMMHDTELSDPSHSSEDVDGMKRAVNEFVQNNSGEWVIHKHFSNNNGLTILKRIS